jgi:hypothetical protein
VPLTQCQFALVDERDYAAVVAAGSWCFEKPGAGRRTGYAKRRHRRKVEKLHNFVWHLSGDGSATVVDHKNGNGLDCRRENLRPATVSQNNANCAIRKTNSSGLRGVVWIGRRHRWRAQISVGGRFRALGHFVDKADAGRAYDVAAREAFGEFARTNYQEPVLP